MMTVTKKTDGQNCVLKINGRLDTITAPQLEEEIKAEISETLKRLELECSALDYISSAGLPAILSAKKSMDRNRGKFCLSHVSPEVREVFEITGFLEIIPIV